MFLVDALSPGTIHRFTLVVLTLLVLLTLASQFGQFLYLELTTHFRLHYVLAAIACAVVLTALQSWKFLPFAILCAILNGVYLGPYIGSGNKPQPKPNSVHVRVLHANVLKSNTNYDALLATVTESNADVVVLQEVSEEWGQQIKSLETRFPHSIVEPRAQGAGMAVFSKYEFEDLQKLKLDESTHLAILAKVKFGDRSLIVLSMHPTTPITATKFKNRNQQFKEAAQIMKKTDGPKILIGDLNTSMWSPYFHLLVQISGLRDSRLGFGLKTTWPSFVPSFLRLPIDHCLVSSDIQVDQFRVGNSTGSDHRSIIVDLTLEPEASSPAGAN